ncbi:MAG: S8 family peptidase [Bacteroidia bacterium]
MKRIFFSSLLLLFIFTFSFGQSTRMNAVLLRALYKDASKNFPVLVKGNVPKLKEFIKQHQGSYKYSCGNISSVVLKGTDLQQLAATNFVSRIEYYDKCAKPLDDTSIIKNNILKIHNGVSPLSQAYDGKGITFGLVDTGIDFTHPDFTDSLGKTRVKWLWDQTQPVAANTPMPYGYGQDWDNVQIDSGHSNHIDSYDVGHGTKVSGIAVGNGKHNAKYKGHAPKADIVVGALDFSSNGPVVLDAIHYVVSKCISLNQPFVVNLSIGDYFGSHDGQDLQALAIDTLFKNIPGRCVVAAAGNAGNIPFHLGYDLSADTNFTFIYDYNNTNQMDFIVYADTNNFKQAMFTIGVYDNQSFRYVGNVGFRDITTCLGTTISDTLWNSNYERIGVVQTTADIQGGTYEMLVSIIADSSLYYWTLEGTGQGRWDSWNTEFLYGSSVPIVPKLAYHKAPDTWQTICSSFQCSDEVITVANYTERTGHMSCSQVFFQDAGPYDTLVYNSSIGPTRDKRQKPDIAGTGDNIVTTGYLFMCRWVADSTSSPQKDVVSEDTMYMKFDGTSSASPAVAGLALLYMQKNPTATNRQVKDAITTCAKHDSYTGTNLPNYGWGYGKLDGYNALLCGPMAYQSAVVNHEILHVYPNPSSDEIRFVYEKDQGKVDIKIYSVMGAEVKYIKGADKNTPVSVQNLASGLYLYKVFQDQNLVNEGKFVKE